MGRELHILHFNDVYELEKSGQFVEKFIKSSKPDTLKIFSGDIFYPSILSVFLHGKHMVKLLELLKVDFGVVGNHDVEGGEQEFIELVKDLQTKWICSNMKRKQDGLNLCLSKDHFIMNHNGIKVGMFGLIDQNWMDASTLSLNDYDLINPIMCAKEKSEYLRKQGCDVVIALTHMSNRTDEDLLDAENEIDIVLGGHEHVFLVKKHNDKLLIKSGFDFANFSDITVLIKSKEQDNHSIDDFHKSKETFWYKRKNKEANANQDFNFSLKKKDFYLHVYLTKIEVSNFPEKNEEISNYIEKIQSEFEKSMDIPMAFFEGDFDVTSNSLRTRENAMANFLSDMIKIRMESDLVFLTGGSIRSNTYYKAQEVFKLKDVVKMVPFPDFFLLHRAKGKDLRIMIEQGYQNLPSILGNFLHVSSNSNVIYNVNNEPLKRVCFNESKVNGFTIDDDKVYKVSAMGFVSRGKDGYTKFKEVECLGTNGETLLLLNMLKQYFDLPNQPNYREEYLLFKSKFPNIKNSDLLEALKNNLLDKYNVLTEDSLRREGDQVFILLSKECIKRLQTYLLVKDIKIIDGKYVFCVNPIIEGRIKESS